MYISELKEKARNDLKKKYKEVLLIVLFNLFIHCFSSFLLSNLTHLLGFDKIIALILECISSLLVSSILSYGITSYYLKLSRCEKVEFKEIFSKSNLAFSYIFISIVTGIFVFLWSFLLIIPGFIAIINYSLIHYIKLDNPFLDEFELVKKSKKMMNGHKLDYLKLVFSFLGWFILGIFTFGILYLWLIPYVNATMANFYNQIKYEEITF